VDDNRVEGTIVVVGDGEGRVTITGREVKGAVSEREGEEHDRLNKDNLVVVPLGPL